MRKHYSFRNQKGISLITVLLFMLVATLAATAVYKWLHSTNRSSASRMLQTEAGQASQAGLDAVRSWMSYHAADVGALIKQFEDGNKKPINLDTILRADASTAHNFNVYLTEADVSVQPYRLKFISKGNARDSSSYSQAAIFKVDGLYRAYVPNMVSEIVFDYAFWGGVGEFDGENAVQSMLVNGDWDKNPPTTNGNFVVTGNLTLSGNAVTMQSDTSVLCVGGVLDAQNSGNEIKDLYAGSIKGMQGRFGNVYCDGNITHGNNNVTVNGNMTLNGVFTTNMNGAQFNLSGNLVLGDEGQVNIIGTNNQFTVGKDVWVPTINGFIGANGSILGNDDEAKLYMNSAVVNNGPDGAGWYRYIAGNSTTEFTSKSPNNYYSAGETPPLGAEFVRTRCQDLWTPVSSGGGCDGSNYKVPEAILTAYENFKTYANKPDCATNITQFGDNDGGSNATIDALNSCYENASDEDKYNGFLVVELSTNQNANPQKPLNGNFIFIYTDGSQTIRLPSTTPTSVVMVYLVNGVTGGEGLKRSGETCDNPYPLYNYFIYSMGNIGRISDFSANCPLRGSVYLPDCYKLTNFQNAGDPPQMALITNKDVINALAAARAICSNDVETCGAGGGGGGADPGADGISSYTVDDYYIPLSPRLSVSLQTQYASEEQVAEADKNNKLEPSLMVLPRVIYLPRNPKGKLTDYYSVLKLNGALSNAGTSVCAPGATYGGTLPATTNPLIGSDTTTYLRSDIYNCVFTPAASTQPLDNIPFFVWVGGSTDEVPEVSFEQNQFIDGFIDGDNQCQFVNIKFAVGSEPANVGISVTGDASWIISTLSATGSGPYTATVSGALTPVLKVCRALTPSSDASSIRFDLTAPCDGCRLETSPVPLSWSITGNFNIVRKSLEEKADTTAEQMEFFRFPPCDATYLNGNEWIQAVASAGGNCISKTKNEAWNCTDAEFGTTFMRQASLLSPGLAVACSVMVVPGLVNEGGDTSYTAYGDIRLHPYTLTVASNKTKSVDVDGDAPHDFDTTFNTDGYTRVFYKLPYTVEVSYNESSERLRSATCFVPVMADTSCTHNGGGKFTVTPEGDTELYLKFVNLGDCFNGLTGFTGWGYDCSGNHCAGITNSVAALEVGNTEGMSPGWAQIGADSLTVTAPVITPAGDLVNSVIALKTFRGMTDGYLEATVNMNGLSVSPAVIFRSNVAASDYYSLFVQSVAGINTLQLCDSDFSGINCKALFTLNTLNNTAPFTLTVDFEGQALFASFSQAGAYQSYADSSLVKTGNNRFGFAFPEASASGMNKGELHGFLALSLSADGSCKVDGTTLPVPALGCKTGLTFRTGESVTAGDLVTVNGNGAVCGAPIFTVTPDFVSPLTPGDVGSHSASISVDCRYLTTIDAPPSPSEVTCSFEVLDAAACEFKQEWCPGIDWATGIKWGENLNNIGTLVPNQHDAACLFLSSSDIGWNGLFTATPGDGGYYMYVVHDNQYNTPGANSNLPRTKPDCVGPELAPTATCSWNHTLNPGDPVPQPDVQCSDGTMPTITQIEVEPPFSVGGGGTWLNPGVPGGSGTWLDPSTDDLEDGETYTAKVEVSKCGSKTPENGGIGKWINCTGSVTVGGPASSSSSGGGTVVTIGANGNSENTLNAGQTYEIHCSPENGGQIQCKTEDKTSSSFTWDGTDQTSNPDYWSCQAPCTNNEVHTLIVGPKNIVCRKGC